MITDFGACLCCDNGVCDVCNNNLLMKLNHRMQRVLDGGTLVVVSGKYICNMQLNGSDSVGWEKTFAHISGNDNCYDNRDMGIPISSANTICDFTNANLQISTNGIEHSFKGYRRQQAELGITDSFCMSNPDLGTAGSNLTLSLPTKIIWTVSNVQNTGTCTECEDKFNRDYAIYSITTADYKSACKDSPCDEDTCEEALNVGLSDNDADYPIKLMVSINNVLSGFIAGCTQNCNKINRDVLLDIKNFATIPFGWPGVITRGCWWAGNDNNTTKCGVSYIAAQSSVIFNGSQCQFALGDNIDTYNTPHPSRAIFIKSLTTTDCSSGLDGFTMNSGDLILGNVGGTACDFSQSDVSISVV